MKDRERSWRKVDRREKRGSVEWEEGRNILREDEGRY